jgi:hypothetical protein
VQVTTGDDRARAEGALPTGEEVLGVEAVVVEERRRWIVYLDVVLVDRAVRRKVGDWPDQQRAEVAAREIRRNAARKLPVFPTPPG